MGQRLGFASDAGLIGIAAVVVALTHPGPIGHARYLVIAILAVAMGIQNILIRRWGIPDLATNVMTKTMAFLVADSTLGGGNNPHAARRGVSIVIFAIGATVGAFLTRYGVLWPILTAFTLFVLALPILLQPLIALIAGILILIMPCLVSAPSGTDLCSANAALSVG